MKGIVASEGNEVNWYEWMVRLGFLILGLVFGFILRGFK